MSFHLRNIVVETGQHYRLFLKISQLFCFSTCISVIFFQSLATSTFAFFGRVMHRHPTCLNFNLEDIFALHLLKTFRKFFSFLYSWLANFLKKYKYSEFLGGVPISVRVGQPDKSVGVSFTGIDDDHRPQRYAGTVFPNHRNFGYLTG